MALPIFPTLKGIVFPVKRAPMFRTLHQESASGQDNPVELWTYPRWAYEVAYSFLRSDSVNLEWQTLAAFFLSQRGSSRVFQFTDPDNGTVTAQPFGTGDGTTVAFPLVRTLTGLGGITFAEPVFAPTAQTIYDNGVPTVLYTLGTQGMITFNSPPTAGHALTRTGTFSWLCRFDVDVADIEKFAYQFFELKKITFTTIKTQSK